MHLAMHRLGCLRQSVSFFRTDWSGQAQGKQDDVTTLPIGGGIAISPLQSLETLTGMLEQAAQVESHHTSRPGKPPLGVKTQTQHQQQ